MAKKTVEKEPKSIGDVVRVLREVKGLSQNGLAKLLRTTPTAIALWEAGLRKPNKWVCGELAGMANTARRQLMEDFFLQQAGLIEKYPSLDIDEDRSIPKEPIIPDEVIQNEIDSVSSGEELAVHSPAAAAPDPYDGVFKNLRIIIDSGQSQLIGQAEEVLSRLADEAQHMSRKIRRKM